MYSIAYLKYSQAKNRVKLLMEKHGRERENDYIGKIETLLSKIFSHSKLVLVLNIVHDYY